MKTLQGIITLFVTCLSILTLPCAATSYMDQYAVNLNKDGIPTEYRIVLDPRQRTTLSAEVNSKIKEISREMGDAFNSGDILVRLEDKIFRAIHKKTKFLLQRAQEQLTAKRELFDDNVASLFELKNAQAELAVAEADLETAMKELESCTITAPYSGHIDNILINQHETIQVGQPIVKIVNDKTLLGKLLVPSYFFDKVKLGQALTIRLKENDQDISAVITHIGAVIDPSSSMFKIFAEIDNRDGNLRAGMTGTTSLKDF
ncbi:MAG: membrane fusion protein (multidrug efflux system) [Chlamydiales bacterium]|jgi:membrane fusion protein (multidrug efflux system)